jgi:23S rRNA (guanosine2251-2'-O)-methyltransferase
MTHILEGDISIIAALTARSREIHRIYIDSRKSKDDTRELERLSREASVRIERMPRDEIDKLASGKTHGGVIAFVGERRNLQISDVFENSDISFVVMLDGIEDPFNFGQAIRALYAAGVDGLIIRPRNWSSAEGVVARASAGASELMPTAIAKDVDEAAAFFKSRGFKFAVTARDKHAESIYNVDLTKRVFLLIGGEKRGVNRKLLDEADLVLRIPYSRKFPHSLGSASSTAVIAFEIMRQQFAKRS